MKLKDIKVGDRLTYRGRDHENLFWGAVCEVVSFTGIANNIEVRGIDSGRTLTVHAADLAPEGEPWDGR